MTDPAHPFARATYDLLMVMHDRQLPPPMALTWSPYTSQLTVQVPPGDFLRWLDVLTYTNRATHQRDGRTHYTAKGRLLGASEHVIQLTAVQILMVVA